MTNALKDGGGPDSTLHRIVVRMNKGDSICGREGICVLMRVALAPEVLEQMVGEQMLKV